ncbi:flagellar motor protein MotB [Oceanobacillus alkalisoli]|uniref:flagellar motor protein MotB n=1 Tax=Oceanobacillus alkalisoli TaxID=2925113 RepID=UPI001EE4881A|nr:flagellar motor protein MotB [Oceanobacillus alkalisoli]MCG5102417.1 OmpA family protein [Oceanobacillus alkalisoli]
MSRRRRKKTEQQSDDAWLLPYSDMLTLLVALFIVLFAMSEIDAQKYEQLSNVFKSEFSGGGSILLERAPADDPSERAIDENEPNTEDEDFIEDSTEEAISDGRREVENLRELQARINGYIETNELSGALSTELSNEGLMLTILNDVTFDMGSAEVNDGGREIITEVSRLLNTDPPHHIEISGHADDRPINNEEFPSNWELSVIRAVNFMGLILGNDDHDPARFSAKGFGEYRPIVPNTSEANREKNRRVEVLILPNYEIDVDEE